MSGAGGSAHAPELRDAIASGVLSGALLHQAQDLLAQVERPVRLALLGLPGCGKTSLMNMLAGTTVVPQGVKLPSVQLVHGDAPSVDATLADGTLTRFDRVDLAAVAGLAPVFVKVAMPLPALTKISMLEVVADGAPEQQVRALLWAAKKVDIAIWCSAAEFSETEQDIWDMASDDTRDKALLVLTKTDRLAYAKQLVQNLAAQHSGAFKRVLGIDTLGAIAARQANGAVDKDALRASGGMALISAILKDVEEDRQAARDRAEVFLHQIDYTPQPVAQPAPAPAPDANPESAPVAAPEPVSATAPIPGPIPAPAPDAVSTPVLKAKPLVAKAPEQRQPAAPLPGAAPSAIPAAIPSKINGKIPFKIPGARPAAVETPAPAQIAPRPTLEPASRDVCAAAATELAAQNAELAERISGGAITGSEIVSACLATAEWLADYLAGQGAANDPVMQVLREASMDACDLMQLIELETGETVTRDALGLLVQLRDELSAELAA